MKRARTPKWSFVVMRGADKTVKQFHVSKRSVIAVPALIAIAISSTIAGLQLKSAAQLSQLEQQISEQSAEHVQTISSKDEAIVSLQQEVAQLSREAEQMKSKMEQLAELELKLQRFIDKYGSTNENTSTDVRTDAQQLSLHKMASKYSAASSDSAISSSAPSNYRMTKLAGDASLDFDTISDMIDTLGSSMDQAIKEDQERQAALDGYPSSWPTTSKRVTSSYGYRKDPFTGKTAFHAGIDIQGKQGDLVLSAADGVVGETGTDSSMGHYIVVDHYGDLQTVYMHLKQIDVKEGDSVKRSERIGLVGSSGRSTGPHLHFQILQKSETVNPIKFLALVKES